MIIEDKVDSGPHSGQLKRYLAEAMKDGGDVVPFYFKTGYHFDEDVAAANDGYTVIGLDAWVNFLTGCHFKNDILEDYRRHSAATSRKRERNLAALESPHGFEHFSADYVQYAFMKRLVGRCSEAINGLHTYKGNNNDGGPWTQHRFVKYAGALPGDVDESIFYRIDKRRDDKKAHRWCLSLKHYAVVKDKPDARGAKDARLLEYRRAFRDAVDSVAAKLDFANPIGRKGAMESEIGILFFDATVNTPSAVIEGFPPIHRALVAKIRELRGAE